MIFVKRDIVIVQVPQCEKCGGTMKPDIVFFGDNVASSIVDKVYRLIDNCDTVLVLGSSLFVSKCYWCKTNLE